MKSCIRLILFSVFAIYPVLSMNAQYNYEKDSIPAQSGEIALWAIGHGTLMFTYDGMVIHIDPVRSEANYEELPDGDIILVTHSHGDHLDPGAIKMISKESTIIICNSSSAGSLDSPVVMSNGDKKSVAGITVEAVPAYNIVNVRSPGNPFHPRGEGNGYILTVGGKRIYVAGDTENIPEMGELGVIDVAYLPMNLPYTMTPEMAAAAARMIAPEIFFPYHFGNSDTGKLTELLKGTGIDIRVRRLD